MQVDEPLVDPHLEPVPGLGPLPAGRLPCGDSQRLQGGKEGSQAFMLMAGAPGSYAEELR